MQIQVMGHHSGTNDTDGHVEHAALMKMRGHERTSQLQKIRLGLGKNENLDEITEGDGADQQQHDRLDGTHAETLKSEKQKYVQAGDNDSPKQRNMEQQVNGDGAAEDFGQITCADSEFAHQPIRPAGP